MLIDFFSFFQWLIPQSNHRLDNIWDLFLRGGEHEEKWNLKLVSYKIPNMYLSKNCRVNIAISVGYEEFITFQFLERLRWIWNLSLKHRIRHTWWLFGNISADKWHLFASIISGIYLVPAFEQLKVSALFIKDILIKIYFRCYIFKTIIWSTEMPCVA